MATNSAQGSGTGAAPATTQTATNSAGGPGAEDPTTQKAESPNPYSLPIVERKAERKDTGKFPVAPIFVGFAIGGPIMLVGLPLGALLIVHHSGCCMATVMQIREATGEHSSAARSGIPLVPHDRAESLRPQ